MPGCAIPIRQVDSRCQRTRDAAIRSHGTTHLSFENRSAQRGRGECRASNAPAASRATESRHTSSSHHRSTGTHRHSRTRNGFNGLLRALPGVHDFLVTVARGSSSARLAPAQGCQDHTPLPHARCRSSVQEITRGTSRPSHPAPRLVTIGRTPLLPRRDARIMRIDLRKTEGKYF